MVVEQVRSRKYLDLVTTPDPRFFHAIVSVRCTTSNYDALAAAFRANNVNVIGGPRWRVSTHIHSRPGDIEKLFQVSDAVCR